MVKTKVKKALVIGSNSFSAGSLIESLLKKNFYVIGISRSKINNKKFQRFSIGNKNYKFYKLDINKNNNKILEIIKSFKPAFIINYASQSMVGQSWKDPEDWFLTNSLSTIKLYSGLSKQTFKFKLIHISTPEIYGNIKKKVIENNNYNPTTPYAVSRVTADQYLKILNDVHKIDSCSIRASNVYGEYQRLYRIIPKTIYSILKKKKLNLDGGGISERNFIHIDDVSNATYKIMTKGKKGEIYHISSNEIISIKKLVKLICKKMNYDFDKLVNIVPERLGKDKSYSLANKKIKKLGWKPHISLSKGLDRCIKNIIENISEFKKLDENYVHKK